MLVYGGHTIGICHPSWASAAFGSHLAGQSSVLTSLLEQWKQVPVFLMPRVLAASQGSDTMLSPLLPAAAKHKSCLLVTVS